MLFNELLLIRFNAIPGGKMGFGLYRKKLIYDVINIVIMSILYFFNIYYKIFNI